MRVEPVVLEGRHVRLEPLSLDHLDRLTEVGIEPELWEFTPSRALSREGMQRYIEEALARQRDGMALPFATVDKAENAAVGSTRFANIDRENHRVEIGWTWIATPWQRSALNTESKYLMLTHAFEVLGCVRVELKTDALNERSRAAIKRIGAVEEGILRKHLIMPEGRYRDTAYYSILDSEWDDVKARLEAKLNAKR